MARSVSDLVVPFSGVFLLQTQRDATMQGKYLVSLFFNFLFGRGLTVKYILTHQLTRAQPTLLLGHTVQV